MEKRLKMQRNYGIDLLRALSMLFVICCHILMQGGVLAAEASGTVGYAASYTLYTIAICAVDCFVIISGYVACQSSFRLSRIIELWLTVVFWSVVVSCAFFILQPETRSIRELVSMWLPILRGRYWFFNAYFVMFMFSPVLNHIIATLNQKTFKLTLFSIVCIFGLIPVLSLRNDVLKFSGGAEFCWFFMLYLIGGYIRKYGHAAQYKNYWNAMIVIALAVLNMAYKIGTEFVTSHILGSAKFGDLLLLNSSPIVLGEAVFLFLFFKNLNIDEESFGCKIIKWGTPLIFSVYIIHVHPLIFWNSAVVGAFAPLANLNPLMTVLAVMGIAWVIFALCILLDSVRQLLFRLLKAESFCKWAGERITYGVYWALRLERAG